MDMPRMKKMFSLTLDPELMGRFEAWIAEQQYPPAKNAVIARLLMKFLDEEDARKVKKSAGAK